LQAIAPIAVAASMCLALVLLAMTPARAGNGAAEAFVQNLIDEGLTILRDTNVGLAARRARFHQFVVRNADARTTALFALGRYRRGVSEPDLERYVAAFRDYVSALYEIRLEERKDANLKVTASVDNKADDVTVTTEATDPKVKEPVKIAFRLIGAGGPLKVVDVQVAGVWISVEQRDQFAAILSKSNGDVAALVTHLIAQTARMRSREQPA
jgi:phospholipid transport system substrate-binding protein